MLKFKVPPFVLKGKRAGPVPLKSGIPIHSGRPDEKKPLVLSHGNAGVVKRSNTTDCKSVGIRLRGFESLPQHHGSTGSPSVGFLNS